MLQLDRCVAGNTKALATVRVPTEAGEQKRCASRPREQIKRHVQRVAAPGCSLLLTQGCQEKKAWGQEKRWEKLQTRLTAWLVAPWATFRRLLVPLHAQLEQATQAVAAKARS